MKCPSGNPGVPVKVCNMKMVWLHIHAKSECTTESSDEESEKEEGSDDKEEDEKLQDLLGPAMTQTTPFAMTANKGVINLENNNNSEAASTEKSKNSSKAAKKKSLFFSVSSSINSVERKRVIAQAKKSLEGKAISYSCQYKKPAEMENSTFFAIQQQMKQQKDDKAAREQQLMLAQMEREATERACKEYEVQ
eukprot:12826750-Ditylum_brightwellii.AAC.1